MARAVYGFCQLIERPPEQNYTLNGVRLEKVKGYVLLHVVRLEQSVCPGHPCSPNSNVGAFLSETERQALRLLEKKYGFDYIPDWRWHFVAD